jgi:hypothetical protein
MWPRPLSMVWSAAPAGYPSLVRRLGLQLPGTSGMLLGLMRVCHLGKTAGQPVTMKVAEATLPLWRPLARKVSFLPG